MSEELKKEAEQELAIGDYWQVFDAVTKKWINRFASRYIDKATLAERKRCAEIARKMEAEDTDYSLGNRDAGTIATAIERGDV